MALRPSLNRQRARRVGLRSNPALTTFGAGQTVRMLDSMPRPAQLALAVLVVSAGALTIRAALDDPPEEPGDAPPAAEARALAPPSDARSGGGVAPRLEASRREGIAGVPNPQAQDGKGSGTPRGGALLRARAEGAEGAARHPTLGEARIMAL